MPLAQQVGEAMAGSMSWWLVGLFLLFMLLELAMPGHGRGARADSSTTGRFMTNFGMALLAALVGFLIPFSSIIAAEWAAAEGIGLFNSLAAPWWAVLAAALLSRTFINYWMHRAFHAVPWLWRLHRIHHSDRHVDLSLGLRQHPLDYPPRLIVFASGTVLFGLPVWAVVIADLFLVAANYWEHIDARMPRRLARWLGYVFATPEIHRIHHSASQPQTDSNFSGGLIVWDRLFGTYRDPEFEQIERIGLGEAYDPGADDILSQLALPFRREPARTSAPVPR